MMCFILRAVIYPHAASSSTITLPEELLTKNWIFVRTLYLTFAHVDSALISMFFVFSFLQWKAIAQPCSVT